MRLSTTQLQHVAELYGRKLRRVHDIQAGYRNTSHSLEFSSGARANFIVYKNEPGILDRIRRLNALSLYLEEHGAAVRAPIDERIMKIGSSYGCLYSYFDGHTIPWEAYTKKHIKLLGAALASFHSAGAVYTGELPWVTDEYRTIMQRVTDYFARDDVREALEAKLQMTLTIPDFDTFLSLCESLKGEVPLHMDLVRSNVIFHDYDPAFLSVGDVSLAGMIDIEKAAYGHPLFDVARTLAFLIVDCPKPAAKIASYFIDSGYRKRGGRQLQPVTIGGHDMLEQLVTMFLIYDLYKFLRNNPYESLPHNHHFVRTVAELVQRSII